MEIAVLFVRGVPYVIHLPLGFGINFIDMSKIITHFEATDCRFKKIVLEVKEIHDI